MLAGCKPPQALQYEESAIASRLTVLREVLLHADEGRARQVKVVAELNAFDLDPARVAVIIPDGGTAGLVGDEFEISLPARPIAPAAEIIARVLEAQPELRPRLLLRTQTHVRFRARHFDAAVYVEPEPSLTVVRPAFCSRACKELAQKAAKEEVELQHLVAKAKTLTLLASQERRLAELRVEQNLMPANADAMELLGRLVIAPWFAMRDEPWVEFDQDGVRRCVLRVKSVVGVTRSQCEAHFDGLATCAIKAAK